MNQSYPKQQKLKGTKAIDALFSSGKSIAKYPLRLVYVASEKDVQFGVSVSKKYFKKAVDRNYIKRLMRENYRLQKKILSDMDKPLNLMMLYQSKDLPSFSEIESKTMLLFKKLAEIQAADSVDKK